MWTDVFTKHWSTLINSSVCNKKTLCSNQNTIMMHNWTSARQKLKPFFILNWIWVSGEQKMQIKLRSHRCHSRADNADLIHTGKKQTNMKARGLTWTFLTASFHISNRAALQLCTNTTELRLQALGSAPGVKTLPTPAQLAQDHAAS